MTTININLLPEELRNTKSGGGGFSSANIPDVATLVPIGIGVVVALGLIAIPWAVGSFYLDAREAAAQEELDQVTQEINKYNTTLGQLKSIADNKEFLRQQLATLQSVAGASESWGTILNEMRSVTPANLWFDSMKSDSTKGGTITLSGGALDYGSVAYFHRNLEHSETFYEPVLTKTDMTVSDTGVTVVKWEMVVQVRVQKKT